MQMLDVLFMCAMCSVCVSVEVAKMYTHTHTNTEKKLYALEKHNMLLLLRFCFVDAPKRRGQHAVSEHND